MDLVDEENFAENVREAREGQGWSQGELARRMVAAGWESYSQMTVSRTEKHERPIRLAEAIALANIFNTTLSKMLEPPTQQRLVQEMRSALGRYLRMTRDVAHLDSMIERTRAEVLTIIRDASLYADKFPETPQADVLNKLIAEATLAISGNSDGEHQAEA